MTVSSRTIFGIKLTSGFNKHLDNMDQAKRGADALSAGNFAQAIKEYTAALNVSPTSPDYLIKRSIAYQRSSPPDYTKALSDSESAVIFAQKRAKRELILQAQLRRAIALFGLERYADAKFVLDVVKRMDPKEKTLAIWEQKIATKLGGLSADDPKQQVTVTETPEARRQSKAETETITTAAGTSSSTANTSTVAQPVQTPADKIRHDWYQNSEAVTFTLLAKGVPKDKATIDIQPRSLTISFPTATQSTYSFSLDPLYAAIDVAASTSNIMSTKIEVVLKKVQPGQKWHGLESSEPMTGEQQGVEAAPTASTGNLANPASAAPAPAPVYPTSSRHGPKNWDKVVSDMTSKKKKDGNGADEEEDDDDDAEGDQVNAFFKKLYSGADPDTRRAMMKSFTESNGTALSTNWNEVGRAKVETSPPDGMEVRKWQ